MIYMKVVFELRKISGIFGSVPGVTNGFRGSTKWAHHTPSGSHGPEGGTPAPGGLGGRPKKAYAARLEEKGKSKWGREGILLGVGLEVDSSTSSSLRPHQRGSPRVPATIRSLLYILEGEREKALQPKKAIVQPSLPIDRIL